MKEKKQSSAQGATEKAKTSQIKTDLQQKDFQLNDREKELIQSLFSWSKQSRETNWTLGQPI